MIRILNLDGTETPRNGRLSLEAAQKAVGGYVELIRCGSGSEQMLVDEDGLVKGLSYNRAASVWAGRDIVGVAIVLDGHSRWK